MKSNKPHIAYFSNQFSNRAGHGIARYARHLFKALAKRKNTKVVPIAAWSDKPRAELESLIHETGLKILPGGRRFIAGTWTYFGLPRLEWLYPSKVDIVHAVAMGYPIATAKNLVVTVHDIGPLTHPQYFSDTPPWLMEKSLKQTIDNAKAIICVSQTTQNELLKYVMEKYRRDISDKCHVVMEGVDEIFFEKVEPSTLAHFDLDLEKTNFILAAGKLSPRKNVKQVMKALSMIKKDVPHHLVCVGGDGWDFEGIKEHAVALGIEDRVHFLGYVSDDELRALYRMASAFVYPSLFEGFGLTILEAMASECPVITSNRSSLPEVAGDAAYLIDPDDAQQIGEAIRNIIQNEELRNEMISKGLARAKEFSWEKCAEGVEKVYLKVYAES